MVVGWCFLASLTGYSICSPQCQISLCSNPPPRVITEVPPVVPLLLPSTTHSSPEQSLALVVMAPFTPVNSPWADKKFSASKFNAKKDSLDNKLRLNFPSKPLPAVYSSFLLALLALFDEDGDKPSLLAGALTKQFGKAVSYRPDIPNMSDAAIVSDTVHICHLLFDWNQAGKKHSMSNLLRGTLSPDDGKIGEKGRLPARLDYLSSHNIGLRESLNDLMDAYVQGKPLSRSKPAWPLFALGADTASEAGSGDETPGDEKKLTDVVRDAFKEMDQSRGKKAQKKARVEFVHNSTHYAKAIIGSLITFFVTCYCYVFGLQWIFPYSRLMGATVATFLVVPALLASAFSILFFGPIVHESFVIFVNTTTTYAHAASEAVTSDSAMESTTALLSVLLGLISIVTHAYAWLLPLVWWITALGLKYTVGQILAGVIGAIFIAAILTTLSFFGIFTSIFTAFWWTGRKIGRVIRESYSQSESEGPPSKKRSKSKSYMAHSRATGADLSDSSSEDPEFRPRHSRSRKKKKVAPPPSSSSSDSIQVHPSRLPKSSSSARAANRDLNGYLDDIELAQMLHQTGIPDHLKRVDDENSAMNMQRN